MAQIQTTDSSRGVDFFSDLIRRAFPNFVVETIMSLGEGWMSRAFLVNDKYVFRFPKTKIGGADLDKEIRLLPELQKLVDLQIPNFEFVGMQENHLPFVGYQIIPGDLLNEERFHGFAMPVKSRIAKQLATFMDQVQSFPVERAEKLGINVSDTRESYREDWASFNRVAMNVPSDVVEYVNRRFEEFLKIDGYFTYQPTLLHADLSVDHLLFDAKKEELCGVIDFGDMEITDPDYEYSYLLKTMGDDFTKLVMEYRGETEIEAKMKKIGYFVTFDWVDDILGTELLGIPASTKETAIEELRKEMRFYRSE